MAEQEGVDGQESRRVDGQVAQDPHPNPNPNPNPGPSPSPSPNPNPNQVAQDPHKEQAPDAKAMGALLEKATLERYPQAG